MEAHGGQKHACLCFVTNLIHPKIEKFSTPPRALAALARAAGCVWRGEGWIFLHDHGAHTWVPYICGRERVKATQRWRAVKKVKTRV